MLIIGILIAVAVLLRRTYCHNSKAETASRSTSTGRQKQSRIDHQIIMVVGRQLHVPLFSKEDKMADLDLRAGWCHFNRAPRGWPPRG